MAERHPLDRVLTLGLVVLLLVLGTVSFDRAQRGRYDFHHFYLDARYVWEHGELNPQFDTPNPDDRRQLPFYLPVVSLALAPMASLGRLPAAGIWAIAQMAALGYSLHLLRKWSSDRYTDVPAAAPFGVALLIGLPALIEATKFNQLSFFVLALVLAGLGALDRRRGRTGGVLIGLAAVLKLLPALLLLFLLFKRRWHALAAAGATIIIVMVVPPLLVFGPEKTVQYHREWYEHNVRGDAARGLLNADLAAHFTDRRNQAIPQVLARLTWPEHPHAALVQPLHLEPAMCQRVSYGVMVLLLAGLVCATRRPWRDLGETRRHCEGAVYAIGMLVFAPLLRQYYLVWALPGLALLARAAASQQSGRMRSLGWSGLAVWTVGMVAWIWPLARVLGAHLLMLIVMGVLLLWVGVSADQGRRSATRISADDAE